MPNDRPSLGTRISEWLFDIAEKIGLFTWTDEERQARLDWIAANSYSDLEAYAAKYGYKTLGGLRAKARMIGLSEAEINRLVSIAPPEASDAPSLWVAGKMEDLFADPHWAEFQRVLGSMVIDPWLASITQGRIPTDAPEIENIRLFLGNIAGMESLGSFISSAIEVMSAGQIENAGRMFTEAKWTLGTCFTSWQSTSPIVQAVILEPLQKLINRTFRPTKFTRAQWMDLYALGKIGPARLMHELQDLGYSGEKIAWLVSLAETQLSRSDIFALWKKGRIGPVEVASRLDAMGYSRQAVEELIWLNKKEEATEEKGAYIGTLRKAFREQLIGEERLREALKKQGRSAEAIALEISVLKLSWEVEAKTAAKSDIRSAYMQDVIGRPEAEHWLADAGFATHDIKLIIDTWQRQRAPTYRTINKSEILQAWGVNVLSQPEAYQRLRDVGYSEQDATVLMETYAKTHLATKPPVVRAVTDSDIMWAWHAEVLEEDEALARLIERGYPAEDAELIFETFQRLHPRVVIKPPKELAKNDILEAYGRGVIDPDVTFTKLLAIGYSEQDAGILMDAYEARPEALPPEPTIAQLVAATRRGVIDQAVLSQKLTVLGLPAESVQFYVSYAVTPLPERTRSLSRSDIMKLWTEGRHDRGWALERLLAMNYSPEDSEDILWLARPEIEDTETYVLWKAGLIDEAVASAMWFTMGFSEEQIAEYIIVE